MTITNHATKALKHPRAIDQKLAKSVPHYGGSHGTHEVALVRFVATKDKEYLEYAETLLKAGVNPNSEWHAYLESAAVNGNLPAVELLVEYGAIITKEAFDNAVRNEQVDVIEFFLRHDVSQ